MYDNLNSDRIDSVPISNWQQGDFTLDAGGFFYGQESITGEQFDVLMQTEGVAGLIVVSQTCEIVRSSGGRHYVAVCPLIEVKENEVVPTEKGMRPYLAYVENTDSNVFADLRRLMSVHKDLVAKWNRCSGFTTESKRLRFAAALERKFGQFAFPDEFNHAIETFRKRIWKKHDKSGSKIGAVYRSIREIRFRALPAWDSQHREITVIAILDNTFELEVSKQEIIEELNWSLETISWPVGYNWSKMKFQVVSTDQLSVSEYLSCIRGDFDYLSY